MNGEVSPMLWYVLIVGFILAGTLGGVFAGVLSHRQKMKALDILRMYAEKGVEPPAGIVDPLARQLFEAPAKAAAATEAQAAAATAGVHLGQFVGGMFAAALCGGVAWWVSKANGPEWLFYAAAVVAVAAGAGAVARLVAAIVTYGK
jgi:hypothetical protein